MAVDFVFEETVFEERVFDEAESVRAVPLALAFGPALRTGAGDFFLMEDEVDFFAVDFFAVVFAAAGIAKPIRAQITERAASVEKNRIGKKRRGR